MRNYLDEITNIAKSFGFKAANLIALEEIISQFNKQAIKIKFEVPKFTPVSDTDIKEILDQNNPKWRALWKDFCTSRNKDDPKSALSEEQKDLN